MTATTHDYTRATRYYGHDIYWRPIDKGGLRLDAGGWGRGIKPGDFILITNPKDGAESRYQVESVEYYGNPNDQWRAVLTFAPRQPVRKES